MTKYKKIILATLLGTCLVPMVSIPIITTSQTNKYTVFHEDKNNTNEYYYVYNGKYFDTLDDATKYELATNSILDSSLWIGNIQEAIFDQQTKRLDIDRLRPYDTDKLKPAYKNAINNYDYDYDKVKRSYVNEGLVQYKYDDFNGNLFDSRSEAEESIRNSVLRAPTGYYHYVDYHYTKTKINPLNDEDIDEFKIDTLKKFLFSKDENINLSIYSEYERNGEKYLAKGLADKIFNDRFFINDFIYEIYDRLMTSFWSDFMVDKTFNVKLSICGRSGEESAYYYFRNVSKAHSGENTNINPVAINDKTIEFRNVRYNQLHLFTRFLNYNQFFETHTTWDKKYLENIVAREAKNRSDDLNCKYQVRYEGHNHGWWIGHDIDILADGAGGTNHRVDFDLSVHLDKKEENRKAFKRYLAENMVDFISEFLENYNQENEVDQESYEYKALVNLAKSTLNYILGEHFEDLIPILGDLENKVVYNAYHGPGIHDYRKFMTNDYYQEKIGSYVNNDYEEIYDKYMVKRSIVEKIVDLEALNKNNIVEDLKNNIFDYKFVVEYNDKPLWVLNDSITKYINYKVQAVNTIGNDGFISIPLNQYEYPEFKKYILEQPNAARKDIKKNLINISSSFIEDEESNISRSLIPYTKTNGNITFDPIYKKEGFYYVDGTNPNNPSLRDAPIPHDLSESLSWYNNTIREIEKRYSGKLSKETKSCMNNRNGVLRLYDQNDVELPIYYAETLDMPYKFNASLWNSNKEVYTDENTIRVAIRNAKIVEPAKVVVLYNLVGEVVNSGVRLNENERLNSTNDAIYDSQEVVISNLLRTKVILNDPQKVFYEEANGVMTLLDNKIDEIYKLEVKSKKHYFPTYKDAYLYLREYIELNASKVRK